MLEHAKTLNVGTIYAALAATSDRPRYAFLVLQLVAEIADVHGRAGPFVKRNDQQILLRDWLCTQLFPLSQQNMRRDGLRKRVTESIHDQLTGNPISDAALIERSVQDQALSVGRTNLSRAISDLVRAGFLTRHYAGYATNHTNRGGGRNAVYVVPARVLCALGRVSEQTLSITMPPVRQGELFAV